MRLGFTLIYALRNHQKRIYVHEHSKLETFNR